MATRLKFPATLRLNTTSGSWLSMQSANGGGVHDFEMLVQDREERDVLVFFGGGICCRIGIVDAVDLRAFHDDLGADLHGAKRGSGVSRKIGVAGSARENHDPFLFEMPDGAAADVALRELRASRSPTAPGS